MGTMKTPDNAILGYRLDLIIAILTRVIIATVGTTDSPPL